MSVLDSAVEGVQAEAEQAKARAQLAALRAVAEAAWNVLYAPGSEAEYHSELDAALAVARTIGAWHRKGKDRGH